ncbi:MAG: hypothetical protein ACRDUA_07830, partial [Micromonosporaceae bacterium]
LPRRRHTRLSTVASDGAGTVTGLTLLALLGLLGGVLPIAAFLGCLVLRRAGGPALPMAALGGMAVATAVAVAGRLAGYGQSWALSSWAQAAALVAIAAVAAAYVRRAKPDPAPLEDPAPLDPGKS